MEGYDGQASRLATPIAPTDRSRQGGKFEFELELELELELEPFHLLPNTFDSLRQPHAPSTGTRFGTASLGRKQEMRSTEPSRAPFQGNPRPKGTDFLALASQV